MTYSEPPYIPTPDEVRDRLEALNWMREMSWHVEVVDTIFYHDTPELPTVRLMVWKYGPVEAYLRIVAILDLEHVLDESR